MSENASRNRARVEGCIEPQDGQLTSTMNPSVCPPELRPRDREPPDSVPQAERFGEEPPELHPGPAEGRTLRRTSLPEATQ